MITRDEIRSIPGLYKSIQRDKEQLKILREKAVCIPSTLPDHERVQTSPSGNGNIYVEAAVDLDREIKCKEAELKLLKGKAREFIDSMPKDTETDRLARKVMQHRYLKCYTWELITELLGYTGRRLHQIEWETVKDL